MKIGKKYLCKEGFCGPNIAAFQDEIIVINERNINDCEGLIRSGHLVEIEQVPDEELPKAIETDPTLDVDEGKFVRQKKSFPRRRMKE